MSRYNIFSTEIAFHVSNYLKLKYDIIEVPVSVTLVIFTVIFVTVSEHNHLSLYVSKHLCLDQLLSLVITSHLIENCQ